MVNEKIENTSKRTKLSRNQYVLRFGILGWGIPTGILFAIVQYYRDGSGGFLAHLIPALIIFPLGGIIFGRIMWRTMQRLAPAADSQAK